METPDDLYYTKEHCWVKEEGDQVRWGITDFAQSELGDVIFVEFPAVGEKVNRGERIGDVESIKTVSNLYAPLTGTVIAVNTALNKSPEFINQSPYGDGWICLMQPDSSEDIGGLLDVAQYIELIQAGQ
ncbi:MAG TPA: glycine cleavage system protein GcvH [Atribacteraceae bacterium]|nr:glycine cleavage system protein GcvH [Atribacteraceae bacterium]